MRKSVLLATFAVLLLLVLSPVASMANFIDFRLTPFEIGANNSPSYSKTKDSLTLTFTPIGNNTPMLYWDTTDGFGVQAGGGYEADEIEYPESLRIGFSTMIYVSSFDLTDLFWEKGYEEMGQWSLDFSTWNDFSQTDHSQSPSLSNGEYSLIINQEVKDIWFRAPGKIDGRDHEFSVAGVSVAPVEPVHEPATMLLLGFGLIGLVGFGGRKFFKK